MCNYKLTVTIGKNSEIVDGGGWGPPLTRMALTAAGEIRPEGRTSARVENKPKEPVSVQG